MGVGDRTTDVTRLLSPLSICSTLASPSCCPALQAVRWGENQLSRLWLLQPVSQPRLLRSWTLWTKHPNNCHLPLVPTWQHNKHGLGYQESRNPTPPDIETSMHCNFHYRRHVGTSEYLSELSLLTLKKKSRVYLFVLCVCVCTHATVLEWRSQDRLLGALFSPSTMWSQ